MQMTRKFKLPSKPMKCTMSPARYLTDYPELSGADRPFECIQGPGEVFYVPSLWGHGVLYLEDTIGMASLFRS